jgi:hypothetical protein
MRPQSRWVRFAFFVWPIDPEVRVAWVRRDAEVEAAMFMEIKQKSRINIRLMGSFRIFCFFRLPRL